MQRATPPDAAGAEAELGFGHTEGMEVDEGATEEQSIKPISALWEPRRGIVSSQYDPAIGRMYLCQ